GRRPGRAEHGPRGRPVDDGPPALADLPDAPALEVRPPGVRRPNLPPVLRGPWAPPAGLPVHRGARSGIARTRGADLPEPPHAGRTPSPGHRRPDGAPALFPARRLVGGDRGRATRAVVPPVSGRRGTARPDEGLSASDPDDAALAGGRPAHRG